MKYVLLKGLEGFGDRLQCLLQAIAYAKATGRILVVDWHDSDWTHDFSIDFENYFSVDKLGALTLNQFIGAVNSLSANDSAGLSVFPAAWSCHLSDLNYEAIISDPVFALPDNGACLKRIIDGSESDFDQTVVVYPGIGFRQFECRDAEHLIPSCVIMDALQECVNQYQLVSGQYDIVHLRGGTKHWAGGSIQANAPNYHKHIQWATAEHYIQEIYDVLQQLRSTDEPRPLYILTDTPRLSELWIHCFGDATLIKNQAHGLMGDTGIHKITRDSLESAAGSDKRSQDQSPLTKHILNIEAIRDFILMNHARHLVGDGVSTFSYLAYGFKVNKVFLAPLPSVHSPLETGDPHCLGVSSRWRF